MSSLLCFLALSLLSCDGGGRHQTLHFTGGIMGTTYNVTVVPGEVPVAEDLQEQIHGWLEAVNQSMSTYLEDSELSELNRAPVGEWLPVSAMMAEVLLESQKVSELSDGAFDVTIAPLVDLWGFGPVETNNQIPGAAALERVRQRIGYQHLSIREAGPAIRKERDLQLDLSAIAKGFAADYVGRQLQAQGLDNYLVEIGGDLVVRGHNHLGEPWRIGVEKPSFGREGVQQTVALAEGAIATSGDYRNFYQQDGQIISHILDPRLGRPAERKLASVTVIAESGARADGLATAFSVMGAEEALAVAEQEELAVYMIVREDEGFSSRESRAFAAYRR